MPHRGGRGPAPTSATSSPATRGKILAGNPIVVAVEAVGIARFEVFLGFLLGCEIGAVVVNSAGRRSGEKGKGGGHEERWPEERKEAIDCATLSQHWKLHCRSTFWLTTCVGWPLRKARKWARTTAGYWLCSAEFYGRYWARTSDLQLVELALSQLS